MAAPRIGLDIGRTHLRAVAVAPAGRGWRITAAAAVRRLGAEGEEKPLAGALAELDALLPLRGDITVAAGECGGLIRFLATAPLAPDRLARIIRLELENHAEGGDLAADHTTLAIGGDEQVHCCVIAQPAQAYSLLVDLRAAGVQATRIHHGAVALTNLALAADAAGTPLCLDEQTALVVDIGSTSTAVALIGRDRLLACRVLPIGGDAFTEGLVNTARMTREEAEAAKVTGTFPRGAPPAPVAPAGSSTVLDADDPFGQMLDDGLVPSATGSTPTPAPAGKPPSAAADDDDELVVVGDDHAPDISSFELDDDPAPALTRSTSTPLSSPPAPASAVTQTGLPPGLAKAGDQVAQQLTASVTWLRNQVKLPAGLPLAAVHVCGGGAGLADLDAWLGRKLQVPVHRLDPWALAGPGSKPAPSEPWTYATATALALGTVIRQGISLDLRPEQVQRAEAMRRQILPVWCAAAAVLAAAACLGWTWYARQSADAQTLAAWDEAQTRLGQARDRLKALDIERDALYDDLKAIAGRIYAGRDFLHVIRALKEAAADENSRHLWVTKVETVSIGGGAATDISAEVFGTGASTAPTVAASARGRAAAPGRSDAKAPADTAIDRGAVVFTGFLKFQGTSEPDRINSIYLDWYNRIREWRPSAALPPLFKEGKSLYFDVALAKQPGSARNSRTPASRAPEGSVPFSVQCWFQPTDLSQVAAASSTP
jgi:Tfp pilus assembly PilM family ATPase